MQTNFRENIDKVELSNLLNAACNLFVKRMKNVFDNKARIHPKIELMKHLNNLKIYASRLIILFRVYKYNKKYLTMTEVRKFEISLSSVYNAVSYVRSNLFTSSDSLCDYDFDYINAAKNDNIINTNINCVNLMLTFTERPFLGKSRYKTLICKNKYLISCDIYILVLKMSRRGYFRIVKLVLKWPSNVTSNEDIMKKVLSGYSRLIPTYPHILTELDRRIYICYISARFALIVKELLTHSSSYNYSLKFRKPNIVKIKFLKKVMINWSFILRCTDEGIFLTSEMPLEKPPKTSINEEYKRRSGDFVCNLNHRKIVFLKLDDHNCRVCCILDYINKCLFCTRMYNTYHMMCHSLNNIFFHSCNLRMFLKKELVGSSILLYINETPFLEMGVNYQSLKLVIPKKYKKLSKAIDKSLDDVILFFSTLIFRHEISFISSSTLCSDRFLAIPYRIFNRSDIRKYDFFYSFSNRFFIRIFYFGTRTSLSIVDRFSMKSINDVQITSIISTSDRNQVIQAFENAKFLIILLEIEHLFKNEGCVTRRENNKLHISHPDCLDFVFVIKKTLSWAIIFELSSYPTYSVGNIIIISFRINVRFPQYIVHLVKTIRLCGFYINRLYSFGYLLGNNSMITNESPLSFVLKLPDSTLAFSALGEFEHYCDESYNYIFIQKLHSFSPFTVSKTPNYHIEYDLNIDNYKQSSLFPSKISLCLKQNTILRKIFSTPNWTIIMRKSMYMLIFQKNITLLCRFDGNNSVELHLRLQEKFKHYRIPLKKYSIGNSQNPLVFRLKQNELTNIKTAIERFHLGVFILVKNKFTINIGEDHIKFNNGEIGCSAHCDQNGVILQSKYHVSVEKLSNALIGLFEANYMHGLRFLSHIISFQKFNNIVASSFLELMEVVLLNKIVNKKLDYETFLKTLRYDDNSLSVIISGNNLRFKMVMNYTTKIEISIEESDIPIKPPTPRQLDNWFTGLFE